MGDNAEKAGFVGQRERNGGLHAGRQNGAPRICGERIRMLHDKWGRAASPRKTYVGSNDRTGQRRKHALVTVNTAASYATA